MSAILTGCKWCNLGRSCRGPLGIDDIEVGCSCDHHECDDCGSAYCKNVGGPDPCEAEEPDEDGDGGPCVECSCCGKLDPRQGDRQEGSP